MKKNLIFALLAAGSLFSCQQQDEQLESSKEAIITATIGVPSRSISNVNAVKKSFTTGDVISLATSGPNYSTFVIGKDRRYWSNIPSNSSNVKFYALYPALTEGTATRSTEVQRSVAGGEEYLFGEAEVAPGTLNVSLNFKRMTVPVVVVDENGNPYTGNAVIKLNLKNKGTQDLMTGVITVDDSAPTEAIEIKTLSEGTLTNILPQTISAGEEVGTITIDGETEPVTASRDLDLKEGIIVTLSVYKPKCGGGIIDGNVPLFY